MTIHELCRRHRRLALDTSVLIYLLEDVAPWAEVSAAVLDALERGRARATISTLALAERIAQAVVSLRGLVATPVSGEIATDPGVIRGLRGVNLADAIHLASARAFGATAFVTNDRAIRGSSKLSIVLLDELIAAQSQARCGITSRP